MELTKDVLELLLPKEIVDNFDLVRIEKEEEKIILLFDEKFILPQDYTGSLVNSDGFVSPKTIQDFPLRGKVVYLKIRRRRWLVKSTGKKIYRKIDIVSEGTKFTKEFASFLKGIHR